MGKNFQSVNLVEKADKFISNNFVELSSDSNEYLLAIEKDTFLAILTRFNLIVESKNDVLKALKMWTKNETATRGK